MHGKNWGQSLGISNLNRSQLPVSEWLIPTGTLLRGTTVNSLTLLFLAYFHRHGFITVHIFLPNYCSIR